MGSAAIYEPRKLRVNTSDSFGDSSGWRSWCPVMSSHGQSQVDEWWLQRLRMERKDEAARKKVQIWIKGKKKFGERIDLDKEKKVRFLTDKKKVFWCKKGLVPFQASTLSFSLSLYFCVWLKIPSVTLEKKVYWQLLSEQFLRVSALNKRYRMDI